MVATNNLKIDLLEQSQAQKEITVNEAIVMLDSLMNKGAVDKDLSTPPANPNSGDLYIVPTGSTGDWNGEDGKVALYENGWKFIEPNEGMSLWLNDEDKIYFYNGTSWLDYASEGLNPNKLGINATADDTNKLSVNSEAILFNNNGNGVQVKLNKNTVADSASFLFQTGFSGQAEIGLTGDDDFHFKVSPDGSTFYDSIILSKDDGAIDLNNDEITIGRFLRHKNDSDTYMNMIANGIYFRAGGNGDNMILNNVATILNGSQTKNTIIRTDNESDAIYVNNTNDDVTFNIHSKFTNTITQEVASGVANFYRHTNGSDISTRYYNNGVLRLQEFYDVSAHLYRAYTYSSTGTSQGEVYRYTNTAFNVNPSGDADIDFIAEADDGIAFMVDSSANLISVNPGNADMDFFVETINGYALYTNAASNYVRLGTTTKDIDTYISVVNGYAVQFNAGSNLVHFNPSNFDIDFRIDSSNVNNAFLIEASTDSADFNIDTSINHNLRVKHDSSYGGLRLVQFSNNNVVIDNEDGGSVFHRVSGSDKMIVGNNNINIKNLDDIFIQAKSNVTDDYPLTIKNNADSGSISYGFYGMSNKTGASQTADYTMNIGRDLLINVDDDCFIQNLPEGWSAVFSNGDLVLRGTSGGDMFQMIDAGSTNATQCLAYGEIHYANGIGASNTRVGIWGFASTSNEDFYLWNYSGGGFRIGCVGNTGLAKFQLDQMLITGANGSEIILQDNSAATDNGIFDFRCDEGLLRGRINNDAMDLYSNWLRVYTTDYTQIDEVELTGDIIDLNAGDYAVIRNELRVKPSSGNAYLNLQTQLNTGEDCIIDLICESATTRFRQYDGANSYLDIIDNGQYGTLMRFGLDNQGYVNVLGELRIATTAYTIIDDTGNNSFRIRNGNSGDRISIESNGNVQICIDENNNQTGKTFIIYGNGNNTDGTELFKLNENGFLNIQGIYDNTTALASNVYVNSNGGLYRTTSSKRYKKDIQPIELEKAQQVLAMEPITYKSKSEHDKNSYTYYGLIAEDLVEIEPRLVTFDSSGKPDGVQYERIIPLMLKMIQNLDSRVSQFEIN